MLSAVEITIINIDLSVAFGKLLLNISIAETILFMKNVKKKGKV